MISKEIYQKLICYLNWRYRYVAIIEIQQKAITFKQLLHLLSGARYLLFLLSVVNSLSIFFFSSFSDT